LDWYGVIQTEIKKQKQKMQKKRSKKTQSVLGDQKFIETERK